MGKKNGTDPESLRPEDEDGKPLGAVQLLSLSGKNMTLF